MLIAAIILASPQALSPQDFQAHSAELIKTQNWKGLEALSRTQIEAQPKDAPAYAALGCALLGLDRVDEARGACQRAIKLDWRNVEAYLYLGVAYAQTHDRKAVIRTGQQLVAAAPFSASRYYTIPPIFQAIAGDGPINFDPGISGEITGYPRDALMLHIQGTVVLEVEVSENGTPTLIDILAGRQELLSNAIQTMRTSRYKPMLVHGRPVKYKTPFYHSYRLDATPPHA